MSEIVVLVAVILIVFLVFVVGFGIVYAGHEEIQEFPKAALAVRFGALVILIVVEVLLVIELFAACGVAAARRVFVFADLFAVEVILIVEIVFVRMAAALARVHIIPYAMEEADEGIEGIGILIHIRGLFIVEIILVADVLRVVIVVLNLVGLRRIEIVFGVIRRLERLIRRFARKRTVSARRIALLRLTRELARMPLVCFMPPAQLVVIQLRAVISGIAHCENRLSLHPVSGHGYNYTPLL